MKRRLPKAQSLSDIGNEKRMFLEEETIKMHEAIDSIQAQAKKSHFVHGKKGKNKTKFKKGKRGIDRFQDKDWIIEQKKRRRARTNGGVPNDSKYTGRKRKPLF